MLKYFYPILLLLLISTSLKATEIGDSLLNQANSFYKSKQLDSALLYYPLAMSALSEATKWEEWIDANYGLGKTYYRLKKYEKALVHFENCLSKAKEIDIPVVDTRLYLNLIGRMHVKLSHFDEGFKAFTQSFEISESLAINDKDTALASKRIGLILLRRGDHERAESWLRKAQLLYQQNGIEKDVLNITVELGSVAGINKNYEKAAQYYQEVLAHPLCSEQLKATVSINLGNYLVLQNKPEEGLHYIESGIEIYQKKPLENRRNIVESLGAKANLLLENDQIDAAILTYQEALEIGLKPNGFGPQHRKIAQVYKKMANAWFEKEEPDSSLLYSQKSLLVLIESFKEKSPTSNPSYEQLYHEPWLMTIFDSKGDAFYKKYQQESKKEDLILALDNYDLAIYQLNQFSQISSESQEEHNDQFYSLFEKAINSSMELYKLSKNKKYDRQAIEYVQMSKAIILQNDLQEAASQKNANIPDSLMQKVQAQKMELTNKKKELYESQQKGKNIVELQNEVFDLERKHETFIRKIKTNYQYEQVEFDTEQSNIQTSLDDQTAILEYFLGEENIFIVLSNKEESNIIASEKPQNLQNTIDKFRKSLTDYQYINQEGSKAEQAFLQTSQELYHLLIPNEAANYSQLIIIPDGVLAYIPFEVLVKNDAQELGAARYLLEDQAIDYAFSINLIKDNQSQIVAPKGLAGFAPDYKEKELANIKTRSGEVLYDLPEARKALQDINQIYQGDIWLKESASLEQFKEAAPDYNVLHLAMHGLVNNEAPLHSKLVFANNESLEAIDLYNMELNAQMAVLSACNTGYGQVSRGEGVMSLSRAFYYAGCPSIVMSLWSVPSLETAAIMNNFYQELQKGQNKDIALQKAKINFLENAVPKQRHPYFWAGLVTMGDTAPLQINATNSYTKWLLIGGGILGLILLLPLLNRKRTSKL